MRQGKNSYDRNEYIPYEYFTAGLLLLWSRMADNSSASWRMRLTASTWCYTHEYLLASCIVLPHSERTRHGEANGTGNHAVYRSNVNVAHEGHGATG